MMTHFRARRRLGLLAAHALEGRERERAEAHVLACPRCRRERETLRQVLDLVAADPTGQTPPPISALALLTRVKARLDEPPRHRATWPALVPLGAATTLAVVWLLVPPAPAPKAEMPEEMLVRLEASVAREQAARYLSDARDVLVTVTSLPRECDGAKERLDVAAESARSRELLARRALLVESDRAEVASVRPVLDDVEDVLREVAALDSCVRRGAVERVRAEVERRQLLMKIRLMTRELEG